MTSIFSNSLGVWSVISLDLQPVIRGCGGGVCPSYLHRMTTKQLLIHVILGRWLKNGLHVSASTVAPLSWPWEHAWASLLEGETHGAETSCPIMTVSTSVNRELAPDMWASSAKSAGLPSQPTANCRCMSEARQDQPSPAEISWTLNFEPNICLLLCTTEVLWLFCSTVVEIMGKSSVGSSRLTMG